MHKELIRFVREQYRSDEFIPLHAPVFLGAEQEYVARTIASTFVSSVGAFVDRFEKDMAAYTGAEAAVAVVNGTAALHASLVLAGVKQNDLVITQPLTFIATCNAIAYCGATPVFVDVDKATLGMSPDALEHWLDSHADIDSAGICRYREDGRAIKACVPMHTFGHPVEIDRIAEICRKWHLALVEDAAESLGSLYKGQHTGTFGDIAAISFNGNKIITTGGGGMILSDAGTAARAKHLTTTAKKPHPYEYVHDELGYNYRLPNINAALGCAQLEAIERFVAAKRILAGRYRELFLNTELTFVNEPEHARSNYWLNAVICTSRDQRDALLEHTNASGVMTRPVWRLMNHIPLYESSLRGELGDAEWLEQRLVNLPSSVLPECLA